MIDLPCDIPGRTSGVDVSEYQPIETPWSAICASGVLFAQIRSSSGIDYRDARAAEHARRATEAGIVIDYYHFLHSNENARLQAEFCAKTIEKLPPRTGRRLWIDWEDHLRINLVGPARALANLIAFAERIDELVDGEAAIYSGPSILAMFKGLDMSAIAHRSYVVAHYRFDQATGKDYGLEKPIVSPPFSKAIAWQWCGNKGPRIAGVHFDLDRDVAFMPEQEFLRWYRMEPIEATYRDAPTQPDTAPNDPYLVDRLESALADETKEPKE